MSIRGVVIAGTRSGTGKTSLSAGVMGALRRRGHEVVPFKVGPDYIDPGYHAAVCGRPSRNLDTWLMTPDEAQQVFQRTTADATAKAATKTTAGLRNAAPPVTVVEGVMGLFDGLSGDTERCSTAEMAKLLGLPVVLVVDCSSLARSAAAVVHGYSTFDPGLEVAGVILNKVGGSNHARALREALAGGPPILGVVPRHPDLHLESRHLGLVLAEEHAGHRGILERTIDHVEAHVDLDALGECMGSLPDRAENIPDHEGMGVAADVSGAEAQTVAVARDAAFSFYYQDNLDVLREEGAELVFFRPLDGDGLPACDALYLGGGYPEVHAGGLAANEQLRQELQRAVTGGLRVYGECGGYLYLGRSIEYEGTVYPMTGVLPTEAVMNQKRLRLGYVEARATNSNPLAGHRFRGHLFHYSSTTGSTRPAYDVRRREDRFEDGWSDGNVIAGYVHLHFRGSRPLARWLVHGSGGEEESD